MSHLLFVDDDPIILNINRNYFRSRGFCVTTCENADEALNHVKKHPVDCVILDIMMPGINGFDLFCQFKTQITAPIVFLTSLSEKKFLYQCFSFGGGDDFLTKPYDLYELEIRVKARIKQKWPEKPQDDRLEFSPLVIDNGTRQVYINGIPVPLTPYEFDILLLLARSPEHVFSPESIYHEVWKLPDLECTQTVKVHVARMRHKLEAICPDIKFIGNIRKQGYRFLINEKKEETS